MVALKWQKEAINIAKTLDKIASTIESQIALSKEIESDFIWLTVAEGERLLDMLNERKSRLLFHPDIEMFECEHCGNAVSGIGKYCPECGYILEDDEDEQNSQQAD